MSISDSTYKYSNKLKDKTNWLVRATGKQTLLKTIHSLFNEHKYKVNGFLAVKSEKSIYDNDWLYGSKPVDNRLYGQLTKQIVKQKDKCLQSTLYFKNEK